MNTLTAFNSKYQKFAEVKVLHRYFLDNGNQGFFSMNQQQKNQRLASYDIREALDFFPTPETQQKLNGQRMFLRMGNEGFVVWVECKLEDEPLIGVKADLSLEFWVLLKGNEWFNYTDLPMEGLPLVTRTAGSETLVRRTYYQFANANASQHPNLSQGPTASLVDRIDQDPQALPDSAPQGTFAKIILTATCNNAAFSLIDASGHLNPASQDHFQIRFQNRKTWWTYRKGQQTAISQTLLPLSTGVIQPVPVVDFNGTNQNQFWPNPERFRVKQDPNDPQRLISEIFF